MYISTTSAVSGIPEAIYTCLNAIQTPIINLAPISSGIAETTQRIVEVQDNEIRLYMQMQKIPI
jgi:hypothetical protein